MPMNRFLKKCSNMPIYHLLKKCPNEFCVLSGASLVTSLISMLSLAPYYPEYIGIFTIGGAVVGAIGGYIGYQGYRYCVPLRTNVPAVEMQSILTPAPAALAGLMDLKEPPEQKECFNIDTSRAPLLFENYPETKKSDRP